MSKRVKISFSKINEGKITIIDAASITATRERVRKAMEIIVRENDKKQNRSHTSLKIKN
jgi:hypothetical protein